MNVRKMVYKTIIFTFLRHPEMNSDVFAAIKRQ